MCKQLHTWHSLQAHAHAVTFALSWNCIYLCHIHIEMAFCTCSDCIPWYYHTSTSTCDTASHCNTLQHTASHCNTLQHTATHCNTVHHTATQCITLQHTASHCITLHHAASRCNTLQHTASHCNTVHHTASHCITLQHTASHKCIYLSILYLNLYVNVQNAIYFAISLQSLHVQKAMYLCHVHKNLTRRLRV